MSKPPILTQALRIQNLAYGIEHSGFAAPVGAGQDDDIRIQGNARGWPEIPALKFQLEEPKHQSSLTEIDRNSIGGLRPGTNHFHALVFTKFLQRPLNFAPMRPSAFLNKRNG